MKILAFAEQREGKFKKTAYEVVTAAIELSNQLGAEVFALVIGKNVSGIASDIGGFGVNRVIAVDRDDLEYYSTTAYTKIVAEIASREKAEVLLFAASQMGKDLAPRVAIKLDAGLASDCTALKVENGNIVATRPIFAGKIISDVIIKSNIKVFTLRPNVFTAGSNNGQKAQVENVTINLSEGDFIARVVETKVGVGRPDVTEASIIVSGGRGMKAPENFKLIEELADVLGAGVGASRAAVDAGWRPHDEQVGQTGKTVSPNLYIACGISGAIQHLAGMSSSKCIVAINKDKDAPIFQIADYGIVGDALEILPELTKEIKMILGK
ncbi:MAG: Electron transfer flavoprotein, alpha subunit [Ignavibacteriae bacterium]|nr:MAG: Electron transfer flavoprotein, alpha subunit [Ignavibacteriota bacterium]